MLRSIILIALVAAGTAQAAIKEEPVSYSDGKTSMRGFIVYDDAKQGKRPGVIVVHEWWGITPHIHREAQRLAEEGYTAFIADMYGEAKTADNPKDAGALAGGVMKDPAAMKSRFDAAEKALASQASVDAGRIAAISFCFGGSVVLDMARVDPNLAGVAAFHAAPLDPAGPKAEPGKVKAKILVLNGADDPFVKPDAIERFKQEMSAARVDLRFINYPGAVHAFTNPDATEAGKKFNLPLAYNEQADKAATAEADRFLGSLWSK